MFLSDQLEIKHCFYMLLCIHVIQKGKKKVNSLKQPWKKTWLKVINLYTEDPGRKAH